MIRKPLQIALASVLVAFGAAAQAQVGVAISVHQPGVYGRIDIGVPTAPAYVPPAVIYERPVVIAPTPVAVHQRPIYLYVPEAEAHDWAHHCRAYNACGQPVYFVRDQWVRDRYAEHYPHDRRFGHDHDDHRGRDDFRHDHDRDHRDGDRR